MSPIERIFNPLVIRSLKHEAYPISWQAMRRFTTQRTSVTADEIWLMEHDPVYTLGQAGKLEHILEPGDIPIISTDRGGQVTYHGPGQLVVYVLLDLRRRHLGIRPLIGLLEEAVIALLSDYRIVGYAKQGAPGVYVKAAKIASIGLRISRGCCYHGLAINIAMDLKPFRGINPCGFAALPLTQLSELGGPCDLAVVATTLMGYLTALLHKPLT